MVCLCDNNHILIFDDYITVVQFRGIFCMEYIEYKYKNCPVPGGGYVTGFLYHPTKPGTLYLRTDIGGTYKYDYQTSDWHCLSEGVKMTDLAETYPSAFAVDKEDADSLYIVSGIYPRRMTDEKVGKFSISRDGGKTFTHKVMPFFVHGNYSGRGSGYRLVKHPLKQDTFYYASQMDGLYVTENLGDSWERLDTCGEKGMTFVWCSPNGETIIAGSAGIETGTEKMRGDTLHISYDGGKSFEKLDMPENHIISGSNWSGLVPHRYDFDGKYFYVTFNQTADREYNIKYAYSCDCGNLIGGRVLRYELDDIYKVKGYVDITPEIAGSPEGIKALNRNTDYDFGFGGICSNPLMPGLLALSSLCHDKGDMVYISKDYGESWELALYDLAIGNMHFNTSYMQPKYNNNGSLIHWLSDVKLNPFNPDELWFNSGTGVFRCLDFTKEDRHFEDWNIGLEETVHLNVYSPVAGPVKVIDIIGDLGGFAFTELDKQCENSFANRENHRYITCINADFSDIHPEVLISTARGNWIGKSKGGLIISHDYGLTFDRINLPFGISEYIDGLCTRIEKPNVNAGFVAISPDTNNIVYSVADDHRIPMKSVVTSTDTGASFVKTRIYDIAGNDITYGDKSFKVFSDRVKSEVFYGFVDELRLFISKDKGVSFKEIKTDFGMDNLEIADLFHRNPAEIRGENGKSGVFYCALNRFGLVKLIFDPDNMSVELVKLTKDNDNIHRVGLGLLHEDKSFLEDDKAIFVSGVIDGEYGFYRSYDECKSFVRINTDAQSFGDIRSISGDSRCVGRFFLATGSFGLKYGEPVK